MSTPECIKAATRQCEFLARLIEEAEQCSDHQRTALLYGMAKDETENLTKTLRQYLGRKLPAHKVGKKIAA